MLQAVAEGVLEAAPEAGAAVGQEAVAEGLLEVVAEGLLEAAPGAGQLAASPLRSPRSQVLSPRRRKSHHHQAP
jgi:hypothetical protein